MGFGIDLPPRASWVWNVSVWIHTGEKKGVFWKVPGVKESLRCASK